MNKGDSNLSVGQQWIEEEKSEPTTYVLNMERNG